ncbi:MAG: hypothetical protein C0602_01570 [Denitrovibrio sp.]|nr:MAG: hypothetical protein C0602_01570 [Denitrovibrio sp.]
MDKKNNYTFQIVILPVILVVVSMIIVTFLNSVKLRKQIDNDIQFFTEIYISEHKDAIRQNVEYTVQMIEFRQKHIKSQLENLIKTKVDEAVSVANQIYNKNKNIIPENQLKDILKTYLSNSIFPNENGYFFAVDLNTGKIITHENPALLGYNMENHIDAKGVQVLKLQKELLSKNDSAFHDMYFTKPKSEDEFKKRVYVRKFKPYNWLIGTGEYYDTLEMMSKKEALETFCSLSFEHDHDLFISTVDQNKKDNTAGVILVNSNVPELIGKSIPLDMKDSKGNEYYKDFLSKTKDGKGAYVEYWSEKPISSQEYRKLSYVYYHKEWNWLIGSGFYFDDLSKYIEAKKQDLIKSTEDNIRENIWLALLLSISSGLIAYLIARRINLTINNYNSEITQLNKTLAKKVEEEVMKNRKQEQIIHEQKKLADMGQMLNAIAHQWRQPLNVLGLYGQDIVRQIRDNEITEESVEEFKKTHMNQINSLSTTIDDFRNFFKPDKLKETYSLPDKINEIVGIIEVQFIHNNIEIITNYKCNCDLCKTKNFNSEHGCVNVKKEMYGYPSELKHALVNILYNAKDAILDAMDSGDIDKGLIKIDCSFGNKDVTITISNNGVLIPDDIISNIFQPYFTTKDEGKGTGLGLYITKVAIEKNMNGTITVENVNNKTTFTITLPTNPY